MPYAVIVPVYLIAGVLFTLLAWDEETDEWYGELSVNGRYLFFAKNLLFWPVCLVYEIIRRAFRAKAKDHEECG